MKYKDTKCRTCGTQDETLYFMPNAKDTNDYFCKPHLDEEMQKRGKEK